MHITRDNDMADHLLTKYGVISKKKKIFTLRHGVLPVSRFPNGETETAHTSVSHINLCQYCIRAPVSKVGLGLSRPINQNSSTP